MFKIRDISLVNPLKIVFKELIYKVKFPESCKILNVVVMKNLTKNYRYASFLLTFDKNI